jgi:ubiquinone biosynthesis monooxygenase Coq7
MNARKFSLTDRLLGELDTALRVISAKPQARNSVAVDPAIDGSLNAAERDLASRLMRVNHAGETAAQALYRGQAFVASDSELRADLLESATEEHDHLAWCQQRAEQLGGGVSKLAPLWYAGSFAIGVIAGLTGDKTSLGFLGETERQVTRHLDEHLDKLPTDDTNSRAILEQMRADEIRHGEGAMARGGAELPEPVKKAMQLSSKVMTTISYRV